MKYLVIGRGFAAYGYVPALAALRREVWVPSALFNRLQPQQFHDSSDLLNVLETTTYDIEPDAIVLAIRPYELDHFVSALQDQLNPGVRLFLEKPVGVSPQASVQLLQDLSRSGVRSRSITVFYGPPGSKATASFLSRQSTYRVAGDSNRGSILLRNAGKANTLKVAEPYCFMQCTFLRYSLMPIVLTSRTADC